MSDSSQGPGWWMASDGKWYAPELHPDARAAAEAEAETAAEPTEPETPEPETPEPETAEPETAESEPSDSGIAGSEPAEPEPEESAAAEPEVSDTATEPADPEADEQTKVFVSAATAAGAATAEAPAAWTPTDYSQPPVAAAETPPVAGAEGEVAQPEEGQVVTATTNIVAGLIALIGAALIVVGSFLPWGEATGLLSGTVDGFDSNGIGTLIAGVVLAASAGLLLAGVRHVLMLVAVLGSSLTAIGLAVYSMFDIAGSASDKLVDEVIAVTGLDATQVAAVGTGLDISYGLWMVLAGGAVGLISAVFVRFNE